jgi:hypothetical protein
MTQARPAPHTLPQTPQWVGLVFTSTQLAPQSVSPASQVPLQTLAEQT